MSRAANYSAADIETVRKMIAEGHSASVIAKVVGRSRSSVLGVADRRRLGPWRTAAERRQIVDRTIPADFEKQWRVHRQTELVQIYGKPLTWIAEWARELGLVRKPDMTKCREARLRQVALRARNPRLVSTRVHGHKPAPFSDIFRDHSAAGQAADTLRRDNWKVNRCNAQGHYDPKGGMWRCGQVLCTDAELIERASRVEARRLAA